MATDPLGHEEGNDQHDEGGEAGQHAGVGPAGLVGPDEAVDQGAQSPGEQQEPGQVRPAGPALPRLFQAEQRDGQGDDADGNVDEEDPAPADACGDDPAQDRPDRHGDAGYRAPHPEGGAAVAALEGLGQQGQGGGEHHRPAQPLPTAGHDQEQGAVGEPAQEGAGGEQPEPDGEEAPAAVPDG